MQVKLLKRGGSKMWETELNPNQPVTVPGTAANNETEMKLVIQTTDLSEKFFAYLLFYDSEQLEENCMPECNCSSSQWHYGFEQNVRSVWKDSDEVIC